jgi:hypothetical protein
VSKVTTVQEHDLSHLSAISGFYPTPSSVVGIILQQLAPLERHHVALEPSAGRGDIAERLAPLVRRLVCIEPNPVLADLLRAKGLRPIESRFEDYAPAQGFDRIAMNPPFAGGLDMAHVRRAFGLLKPGGVLAALMNDGNRPGDGSAEQQEAFGASLACTREIVEVALERLDHGLLLSSENFRPSDVPVKLVRLRRHSGAALEL